MIPLFDYYRTQRTYALLISHSWGYSADYDRVVALLDADRDFKWENLSVPEDHPLPYLQRLPKSNRHLVHQLDEQIKKVDCVLVLAGMYCAHSAWIQSEIEAAQDFGKPIIAVAPRGQERFPEAVRKAAQATVGWTGASIIGAVRRLAPHNSLLSLPTRPKRSTIAELIPTENTRSSAFDFAKSLVPDSSSTSLRHLFSRFDLPKK